MTCMLLLVCDCFVVRYHLLARSFTGGLLCVTMSVVLKGNVHDIELPSPSIAMHEPNVKIHNVCAWLSLGAQDT